MNYTIDELVKIQVFSDVLQSAFDEWKERRTKDDIDKVLLEVNKYFNKRESQTPANMLDVIEFENKHLKTSREIYEYSKKQKCSLSILAVSILDHFINFEENKEFKTKFSHIDTTNILLKCEQKHKELTINGFNLIKQFL